jgi:hypothetical protein
MIEKIKVTAAATMPRKRLRTSQRYTAPEFKPYVAALGQLALAWNDLQESCAALFWTVMSPPPQEGDFVNYTPLLVWHSVRSDRSQREMLRAAALNPQADWKRPSAREDIKWLLDQAAKLEDARNDAVHSPLFIVDRSLYGLAGSGQPVAPAWWLSNPRAGKLSKRADLLSEFRYCRDTALALADFAQAMDGALVNQPRLWPERPALPNRDKYVVRRRKRRS